MSDRVLNIRDLGDLPGRWRMGTWPADVRRIDRRTPFGNPFRMGSRHSGHPDCEPGSHPPLGREEVIAAYRGWLIGMLARDPAFLEPLRGMRLACWCAPLPCHGDVIAEFIP